MARVKANRFSKTAGDINANERQQLLKLGRHGKYISSRSETTGYQLLPHGTYTYRRTKQLGNS